MRFPNREAAAEDLVTHLQSFRGTCAVVVSIPKGGVPFGLAISKFLDVPLYLINVTKVPFIGCHQVGIGGLNDSSRPILNHALVDYLQLSQLEVEAGLVLAKDKLERNRQHFSASMRPCDLSDGVVVLTDDGVATGYTVLSAIDILRRAGARRIILVTAVICSIALAMLKKSVDQIIALTIEQQINMLVDDYFDDFGDVDLQNQIFHEMRAHSV